MSREPIRAPLGVNVPGLSLAGFQVTLFGRIWVTLEAFVFKDLSDVSFAVQDTKNVHGVFS